MQDNVQSTVYNFHKFVPVLKLPLRISSNIILISKINSIPVPNYRQLRIYVSQDNHLWLDYFLLLWSKRMSRIQEVTGWNVSFLLTRTEGSLSNSYHWKRLSLSMCKNNGFFCKNQYKETFWFRQILCAEIKILECHIFLKISLVVDTKINFAVPKEFG